MWIGWNMSNNFISSAVSDKIVYRKLIATGSEVDVQLLELDKIYNIGNIQMLTCVILTVLIGSFIAYKISDISIRPLKKLSVAMENMTVSEMNEKLPCSNVKDELQLLTKSYNAMVDNVEKSFERERQFSANVAHELRTPLAVLLTKYEVFKMEENPTIEEYEYVVEVSKKKIEYLHSMVENLLSLYRKEERITLEKVNISTILFDVVEMLEEKAKSKQLITEIKSDDIKIDIDVNLFICAIYNIIDNAIEYNCQNGRIYINVNVNECFLEITVEDTGVGIDEKYINSVFTPFYQVKSVKNTINSHCGLGLALTEKIISLHKGSIFVESKLGEGSIFKIILPFSGKDKTNKLQ